MIWVLLIVILCAFVYAISVSIKYVLFITKTLPRVGGLKTRVGKLEDAIQTEQRLQGVIRARIENEKMALSKVKLSVEEAKQELKAAQDRQKQIEWEMYKKGKSPQ